MPARTFKTRRGKTISMPRVVALYWDEVPPREGGRRYLLKGEIVTIGQIEKQISTGAHPSSFAERALNVELAA